MPHTIPTSPFSTLDKFKEETAELALNLSLIDKLFDGRSAEIQCDKFDELLMGPEYSSLKEIFDAKYLLQKNDKPVSLSKTDLYDLVMGKWFQQQADQLTVDGMLPTNGDDVTVHFDQFSKRLAADMLSNHLTRVGPKETEIWNALIHSENEDMARAFLGCPVVKDGDGFKFINDNLISYFAAKLALEHTEQFSYSP